PGRRVGARRTGGLRVAVAAGRGAGLADGLVGGLCADHRALVRLSARTARAGRAVRCDRRSAGLSRCRARLACGAVAHAGMADAAGPGGWLGHRVALAHQLGAALVASRRRTEHAMNAWLALLPVWVLAAVMMALGWHWQRRHANTGIVDVLWAAGLGGAAVLLALLGSGAPAPRVSLALLGGLWGWRLAWHLWRRVRHEAEDGRYRALRERWQGDRRRAARAVPRRSAASRPQLPRRAVALFAPPQLLLRMAALVRLRGARGRLTVGVAGVERTAADVPVPALHQRHSVHRGAGAAHARRGLPRLPAQHADTVSVVSQAFPRPEDGRMTTVALDTVELSAGRAAPGVLGLAE